MARRIGLLLFTVPFALWLTAACGSDDGGPSVSTTGAGGSGGSGGSVAAHPWDKPLCDDPGKPLGGTPATRADTAGALNADATEMVIFGGDSAKPMCPNIPPRVHEGDTWILDVKCGAWEQLSPAVAPPARARHVMVQDPDHGRALLFGGRWRDNNVTMGAYTLFNDVWAFDFATRAWTEVVTTGTGPTPRANTGAAIVGNEMIVFGGNTSTSGISFLPNDDTYALNLDTNEWRQLNTAAAPPARLFHTMTADSEGGRVFIGSGGDENAFTGPFLTDYWVLDVATATWSEIPTAPTFEPAELQRIKAGLAYRPETEHGPAGLVAFGGHDNLTPFFDVRNDVRLLDLTGLTVPVAGPHTFGDLRIGDVYNTQLTDPCSLPVDYVITDMEAPERRDGFAMGVAHGGGAFVVFAGNADCDRLSDAWWFNTATGAWTPIRESLAGISCPRTGNPNCQDLCG